MSGGPRWLPPVACLLLVGLALASCSQGPPPTGGASPQAPASTVAQPQVREWTRRYDGGDCQTDGAAGLAASASGEVFVTGHSTGRHGEVDYVTLAYSPSGHVLWEQRYPDGDTGQDAAAAIALSPDGRVVFVGGRTDREDGNAHPSTIAYAADDGELLWEATSTMPDVEAGRVKSIVANPDGSSVFVTGHVWGERNDFFTAAYDATTGGELWNARYGGEAQDLSRATTVSPDGQRVFVTGVSSGKRGTGISDYATAAYDAGSGQELWVARYDGPGHGSDYARAIGVSPRGDLVFVTGGSAGDGTRGDLATVAYSASDGAQVWERRFDGSAGWYDDASSLVVSPLGDAVFVAGGTMGGPNGDLEFVTIAYDTAQGESLWMRRFGRWPGIRDDYATAVTVAPSGSHVFVAGRSDGRQEGDYLLMRYRAGDGSGDWHKFIDGDGKEDAATAIASIGDGSHIAVTGSSAGKCRADFMTASVAVPERGNL